MKGRSRIISEEEYGRLSMFVKKREELIAKAILAGKIEISPYVYKNTGSCTYCSFRPVCRFDSCIKGYKMRYLKSYRGSNDWEGMAAEEEALGGDA